MLVAIPAVVHSNIGVGVATGKIIVNEPLKPGTIYTLPLLTVVNTGNETSDYEIDIAYHEKQPEMSPAKSLFKISPKVFTLAPGEVKAVEITMVLPTNAIPGKYFAYLEAHPVKQSVSGVTSVGIAAATKLYFTVDPANMTSGIYYRLVSLFMVYAPWPQRFCIAVLIILGVLVLKKYVKFQVINKPKKKKK